MTKLGVGKGIHPSYPEIVFDAQALLKKSKDGIASSSEGVIFSGHWHFAF